MSWVTELEAEPELEPKCPDPGLWPHSVHHPLHLEARLRTKIYGLPPFGPVCLTGGWLLIQGGQLYRGHQDQPG